MNKNIIIKTACFTILALSYYCLSDQAVNSSQWEVDIEYNVLSPEEFNDLKRLNLDWQNINSRFLSQSKFAYTPGGKTVLSLSKIFSTTTGGIYIKEISIVEKESFIFVAIEYPQPVSCQQVNKAIGSVSLDLYFENLSKKEIKLIPMAKDSCKREELQVGLPISLD